jgi:transcriptional regulator with XRE-family HTH domain
MSPREAFGPNLRRIRVQHGISLEQIAARTKVSIALWSGLERNDLSRWPSGIFARSYVREYARIVGADPEATVDEFCRCFPQGDRRGERLIRGQAEIVGHPIEYDEKIPAERDRRNASHPAPKKPQPTGVRRLIDALWGKTSTQSSS